MRIAQRFVERGAQHLVLIERKELADTPNVPQRAMHIQMLEQLGATVHTVRLDDDNLAQLAVDLAAACTEQPLLRGVVVTDSPWTIKLLQDMRLAEFETVWRRDATIAWLLHEVTRTMTLDFLVVFSWVASGWSSGGLAHYATAHRFLDALASYRRACGLPALSINWAQWDGVGMLSEEAYRLSARSGVIALPIEQALNALEMLISAGETQRVVAAVDWNVFKPASEVARRRPLFDHIQTPSQSHALSKTREPELVSQLRNAIPTVRYNLMLDFVLTTVASVLGFDTAQTIDPLQGFFEMGMDSITAVELNQRLATGLCQVIPPTLTFDYPTSDALAKYIIDVIFSFDTVEGRSDVESTNATRDATIAELEQLSEEQLVALLAEELKLHAQ